MANQRKKGVERITLTIPDEMLRALEEAAESSGKDRLTVAREALSAYLMHTPTSEKREARGK